jgi:hypothetical protein
MKEHPQYKGIIISQNGDIFSCRSNKSNQHMLVYDYDNPKLLKPIKHKTGYLTVSVGDKKSNSCYIHRLVAETYIPNPNNLPCVNHIDENKLNNQVSNLEWVTKKQNSVYSNCRWKWTIQNIKNNSTIEIISVRQFCLDNDLDSSALLKTLSGKVKTHKGYKIIERVQFK